MEKLNVRLDRAFDRKAQFACAFGPSRYSAGKHGWWPGGPARWERGRTEERPIHEFFQGLNQGMDLTLEIDKDVDPIAIG